MALTAPRKEIVLPVSQELLTIRKLGPADYIQHGGIPDNLLQEAARRIRGAEPTSPADDLKRMDPASVEFVYATSVTAIVKHPDGQRITYKRPEDCAPGEFSFFDLDTADQDALVREVYAFTGEDVAAARSFPGQ